MKTTASPGLSRTVLTKDIEMRVLRCAHEIYRGKGSLTLDGLLAETLVYDSLDLIRLVACIEVEFDIEVDDFEAEAFLTLRDISDALAERLATPE